MTADITTKQNNSNTTNVWQQSKLNFPSTFESSVGELKKGDVEYDESKQLYLDYPGVTELLKQAQELINSDKEVVFETSSAIPELDLANYFSERKFSSNNRDSLSSVPASPFSSLLTQNYSEQKVLGSFSLAFIEARATKKAYAETNSPDHFYLPEGICHLNALEEAIRAYELCKNDVVVMVIPNNAIKAFRRTRFSGWQLVETEIKPASIGKVYLTDPHGTKQSEIQITDTHITNLDSPIYKVKIGERWVLVAMQEASFASIDQTIKLSLTKDLINSLQNNNKIEQGQGKEQVSIKASLGQAVRVLFNLTGGDFDYIPEALLNFEGGSWSSIATEKASSGRHCGTNSMHEVIKHQWYKHPEVAIPWNYLGFDKFESNLTNDSYRLVLEAEQNLALIECPQYWKKIQQELLAYVSRFVYREFAAIGSKKFLLSTKELMQITTEYLAELIRCDLDIESERFRAAIESSNIQKDLREFLLIIAHTHLMFSSKSDFYSSKRHSLSIKRLNHLAQIEKALEQLCPASAGNFKSKIRSILDKDIRSEETTLLEIYSKQL